jgi:UDP-GlcNAc:undecaprenyl-phosphate GlcNAc-1-phosphate transferase
MVYFIVLILAMFITQALIPLFKAIALHYGKLDYPDRRKIHKTPVPRVGGAAMSLGCFLAVLYWVPMNAFGWSLIIGSGIIILFGLIDDIRGLNYRAKLIGQFIATVVVVFAGGLQIRTFGQILPEGVILPATLSIPLTIIAVIGVTNAINFADGLDGLAGGITLLTFSFLGLLAYIVDNQLVVLVSIAICGVIVGFLRFNTHPAIVFMGDTGSQFLGFQAICLSLHLTQQNNALSPTLPILFLGFPVFDTIAVIAGRIAMGNSPFKADNNHFHHKLLGLGLTHSESVIAIYSIQAILVLAAYFLRFFSDWLIVASYTIICMAIALVFYMALKTGWRIQRTDFIDRLIASRIRFLRNQKAVIKICFKSMEFGGPLLFLGTGLIADKLSVYGALCTVFAAIILLVIALSGHTRALASTLRLTVYLTFPLIAFRCITCLRNDLFPEWLDYAYALSYLLISLAAFTVLKYTRRQDGFAVTPTDFLVLFIAVVVPNLSHTMIENIGLGFVAAQIMVLIFCYEIMIGELRGRLTRQAFLTTASLLIISLKGFI